MDKDSAVARIVELADELCEIYKSLGVHPINGKSSVLIVDVFTDGTIMIFNDAHNLPAEEGIDVFYTGRHQDFDC